MLNTKKALLTYFLVSLIFTSSVFANEKNQNSEEKNEYSIKTLEKGFYYKNIEHQNFTPAKTYKPVKKHTTKTNKNITPKIYNIDLNTSVKPSVKVETITYNTNLNNAKDSIKKGDFQNGLKYLNQISDKSPTWVLAEQAGLYEQINQPHLALKAYDKAISRGENRIELIYNQASCYYKNGNMIKAQKGFEEVVKLSPDFMLAYYNLGNVHFRNSNYFKALRNYKKALELNPLSLDSIYNMGVTLEKIREPKLALKYYLKYNNIDPNDMQVLNSIKRIQNSLSKTI